MEYGRNKVIRLSLTYNSMTTNRSPYIHFFMITLLTEYRATVSIVLIILLYLLLHSMELYILVRKWQLLSRVLALIIGLIKIFFETI